MIGGLLDSLMGKVDYQARAPRIDTAAGQRAIQGQAKMGGDQALAQAYSLAASGRGGGASSALAFREAQRRGAEATANLQGQAVAQQQALQQSANQQQAQAEMQAQQINAGIAQNNAQGLQKLAGTALMGAALMSDVRQKEMIGRGGMVSDFTAKEAPGRFANVDAPMPEYAPAPAPHEFASSGLRPGPARAELPEYREPQAPPATAGEAAFGLGYRGPQVSLYDSARNRAANDPSVPAAYIPQPMRSGVPQDAFTNPNLRRHFDQRSANAFESDQVAMADAYDRGPSAVQALGVDPQQAQAAAANRGDLRQLADMQRQQAGIPTKGEEDAKKLDGLRAMAGMLMQGPQPIQMAAYDAPGFSAPPVESDFTSKELMKARVGRGRVFDTSPERVDRMGRFEVEAARGRMREAQRKLDAGNLWRKRSQSAQQIDDQTRGSYGALAPMSSDFRQKEDLDPVQPTLYRYTPESSYRQALEAAQRTYEDKRAPRMGIIAQDLQRSPAFAPSVVEQPSGQLAIDRDRALSTALAELGQMHKRVAKLEGGKKRGA